jgi:hypothetical protein
MLVLALASALSQLTDGGRKRQQKISAHKRHCGRTNTLLPFSWAHTPVTYMEDYLKTTSGYYSHSGHIPRLQGGPPSATCRPGDYNLPALPALYTYTALLIACTAKQLTRQHLLHDLHDARTWPLHSPRLDECMHSMH